jgi:hypothetical protein
MPEIPEMTAKKLVLALAATLVLGAAARADVLITPPLVAEGDNVLDCYLANVGKTARKVRIEAVTKEGKTVQAGTPTLQPGQEEVVRTPAGLLARYCRFTVPGAGRDYRGSVLVHDLGVGSISALAAF